jgi:hypothetical protein
MAVYLFLTGKLAAVMIRALMLRDNRAYSRATHTDYSDGKIVCASVS